MNKYLFGCICLAAGSIIGTTTAVLVNIYDSKIRTKPDPRHFTGG